MHEEQNKLSPEEQAQLERIREEEAKRNAVEQPAKLKKKRTVQMSQRQLSTDEIWKELWTFFLEQLLNSQ